MKSNTLNTMIVNTNNLTNTELFINTKGPNMINYIECSTSVEPLEAYYICRADDSLLAIQHNDLVDNLGLDNKFKLKDRDLAIRICTYGGASVSWQTTPPQVLGTPFIEYLPYSLIHGKHEGEVLVWKYKHNIIRMTLTQEGSLFQYRKFEDYVERLHYKYADHLEIAFYKIIEFIKLLVNRK